MSFIEWFVHRFVQCPRLWKNGEWIKLSYKEKIWIWYKHHWTMIGQGSSELGLIISPFQTALLYGSVVFLAAEKINQQLNLGYTTESLLWFLGMLAIVLFIANMWLQWSIGNWKDKKDLIALETEIGNRRNRVFREIRTERKKQPHKFP